MGNDNARSGRAGIFYSLVIHDDKIHCVIINRAVISVFFRMRNDSTRKARYRGNGFDSIVAVARLHGAGGTSSKKLKLVVGKKPNGKSRLI